MASTLLKSDKEMLLRSLFVPCETKEALQNWIFVYLGLDLPDGIVDATSTTSPMDMLWEVYNAARTNDTDYDRVMCFASRGSFKTLIAAIMEVLCVVHLRRDVAHMAAIEPQAHKAQSYVKNFFNKPFLREFVVSDNVRRVDIVRYLDDKTGINLTEKQFKTLPEPDRDRYIECKNYIVIVICTLDGANSEHVPFFVVDEVDVIPAGKMRAYEEAKMIPDPREGQEPITMLISTRKFSNGLVQREINESPNSGLKVKHWNIIDVTERCPPERHLPDQPKIPIYRSDDTLRAISKEQYDAMNPENQSKYVLDEGFKGCLENCKIFAMCKGGLATKQTSTSKMLKGIKWTTKQFRGVSLPYAKSQLLCWKPSTEGLIYSDFERDTHVLTAAQIAQKITGEEYKDSFTNEELTQLMVSREMAFYVGMDFGFGHNFSVVLGVRDGNRMFIIGCWSQPELMPNQQVELCERTVKQFNPKIFADTENPQMIKVLHQAGFRMAKWNKGKGSVVAGIDIVRMKLAPVMGDPQLYFLGGDEGVELLLKRISTYSWALGADGKPSDVPDDNEDDEPDAMRYLVMNVFGRKGKAVATEDEPQKPRPLEIAMRPQYDQGTWMRQAVAEALGTTDTLGNVVEETGGGAGHKGSFSWGDD
jgi:hypothetical protein